LAGFDRPLLEPGQVRVDASLDNLRQRADYEGFDLDYLGWQAGGTVGVTTSLEATAWLHMNHVKHWLSSGGYLTDFGFDGGLTWRPTPSVQAFLSASAHPTADVTFPMEILGVGSISTFYRTFRTSEFAGTLNGQIGVRVLW
jgi:hypothetical protein